MTYIHSITAQVQHGKGLGAGLGFPTANIFCDTPLLAGGTRRYRIEINNTVRKGVGPYFPEKNLLEVHILGYTGNLYDRSIVIYPQKKLRDNKSFSTTDELIAQIEKDKKQTLEKDIVVMTFGTFDHFHPGHEAYLTQAKKRGDTLITVIALDATVQKIKNKHTSYSQEERMQRVQESKLVDTVILGKKENHYQCLIDNKPDIICLGYDQESFNKGLQKFYTSQGRDIPTIVRLDAFKPEQYKSSYFTDT